MGLATAKIVGRDHTVVLCDVRRDRLDAAAGTLDGLGITYKAVNCDVTDRKAVDGLLETASGLGPVASVIHTAGVSPSMGDAEYVMRTNAVGTVNVNESFFQSAREGSPIVNVASMAAHMLPESMVPTRQFPQALQDQDAFMKEMMAACNVFPEEGRSGMAYAISKSFVRWYSTSQSERFNSRGLRIVSVSPGSIDTEMGRLEEQAGRRRDGHERRSPALGQAGGDGGAVGVLRQRQGRLPHRHRHPERRGCDRLDDRTSQAGCRERLGRHTTSTQMMKTAVAVASTVNRIVSLWRSSVASDFSNRSSRAMRKSGNTTLIAMRNPPRM